MHPHRRSRRRGVVPAALAAVAMLAAGPVLTAEEPLAGDDEHEREGRLELGVEAKVHLRDSEAFRFPVPLIGPDGVRAGSASLATVDEGTHLEGSVFTLTVTASLGEALEARAKVDLVDLYDRNPTSEDRRLDVDELWLRFGRAREPALVPERPGAYLLVGKIPKFERQDDRHLESYGLVSTAFNRFEDLGLELGVDLGRFLYLRASATQGNPVFFRDPNALAGDNGTPIFFQSAVPPDPELGSGILILYDAEVEDVDTDGDLELGAGLGVRGGDASGERGFDLLVWGFERRLAETVELEGTFYGGDLDLLRGPFNQAPLPIRGDEKREVGANLWLYLGGFSLFSQVVDQELAGLDRRGWEAEAAWRLELPLVASLAGRQLFAAVAPAVRYSKLEPDFAGHPLFPAPSVTWEWEKIDYGVRLDLVEEIDLTVEYADNTFVLASGAERSNDELLVTLRWRAGQ